MQRSALQTSDGNPGTSQCRSSDETYPRARPPLSDRRSSRAASEGESNLNHSRAVPSVSFWTGARGRPQGSSDTVISPSKHSSGATAKRSRAAPRAERPMMRPRRHGYLNACSNREKSKRSAVWRVTAPRRSSVISGRPSDLDSHHYSAMQSNDAYAMRVGRNYLVADSLPFDVELEPMGTVRRVPVAEGVVGDLTDDTRTSRLGDCLRVNLVEKKSSSACRASPSLATLTSQGLVETEPEHV